MGDKRLIPGDDPVRLAIIDISIATTASRRQNPCHANGLYYPLVAVTRLRLADLRGGMAAALTAVPVELVYGLFAVAPLGPAFMEVGLRAALTGCIVVTLLGVLFGGNRALVSGSRPATGLILGSLAAFALQHPSLADQPSPAAIVFGLILLCTVLAGLFQWLFGVLRLGRALKYVPFPVTGGLMFGVGLLMIINSLRPALGVSHHLPWQDVPDQLLPASLLVALVSLGTCIVLPRWNGRLPASVAALFIGTAVHHLLSRLIGREQLGATSNHLGSIWPEFGLWQFADQTMTLLAWFPLIASYALAIAALGSIETLLCLTRIAAATGQRTDADAELRARGIANIGAGLSGSTFCVGNLSRVVVALSEGSRGGVTAIAYSVTLFAIICSAGTWLSLVPNAVTAGIILYFAVGMVDEGTRRVLSQLVVLRRERRDKHYRQLIANASVIALVALVAVFSDLMKAVGIGVVAAMFLFVTTSMKPVVRRIAHGSHSRSLKIRPGEDAALLAAQGHEILILEVDGPLFFGTSEHLAEEIERHGTGARTLILDLTDVPDVDGTGARAVVASAARFTSGDRRCLIAGTQASIGKFLDAMGLAHYVPQHQRYHDLDHALQAAEDELLTRCGGQTAHRELTLADSELAMGLSRDEVEVLSGALKTHDFGTEADLFHLGDPGESLFVAAGASVDILLPLGDGKHKRLVSLAPGVCFGEMALLEQRPRSTTARLLGPSRVWELSRRDIDALLINHPRIAGQILRNIGMHLAHRLRDVTTHQADIRRG